MSDKIHLSEDEVRFEIVGGTEYATLRATTLRDALREHDALRAALTEIVDLELEGDASLQDAMVIADEALNPSPTETLMSDKLPSPNQINATLQQISEADLKVLWRAYMAAGFQRCQESECVLPKHHPGEHRPPSETWSW